MWARTKSRAHFGIYVMKTTAEYFMGQMCTEAQWEAPGAKLCQVAGLSTDLPRQVCLISNTGEYKGMSQDA